MERTHTLVDLFEIVPSAFPPASARALFLETQRTLLDVYEQRGTPTDPPARYRSKQRTLVDPFEGTR
jgi:hypothetical protein